MRRTLILLLIIFTGYLPAQASASDWTEVHTFEVTHWQEALTDADRGIIQAVTIANTGFYVTTLAVTTKDCWRVDHGIRYSKAGIAQYTTYVRKAWCSTTSLYPVVTSPYSMSYWYIVQAGNWWLHSAVVSVNGWYSTNYIHQTLVTFTFKQSFAGQTATRTSTNSTCGRVHGYYTTGNDCSGTFKSATYTGSY